MDLIQSDKKRVVVGLGQTGRSTMRFFRRSGLPFVAVDTRARIPDLESLREEFAGVEFDFGSDVLKRLDHADEIYLSPGIAPDYPGVPELLASGARLSGDLDLFMQQVEVPVIGITGSNAKSTVTTLVGEMLQRAGVDAGVGGNLGTPMLDLLEQQRDCYVLELSSFQLERAEAAQFAVACLLNVSADHMDRHRTMLRYHQLKQSVFAATKIAVFNREDALTQPLQRAGMQLRSFGWKASGLQDFCVAEQGGREFICKGVTPLVAADQLALTGRHNLLNVMAALAIVDSMDADLDAAIEAACAFTGLAHRCELVGTRDGVRYINDSKATNTGACIAALQGFAGQCRRLVLIAGGQTKGADFTQLAQAVADAGCALVLIGEGAAAIAGACEAATATAPDMHFAGDLPSAVQTAASIARDGDIVLLSPACASFDMFSGYEQRGDVFRQAVQALAGEDRS